jgi:hypothetical protein
MWGEYQQQSSGARSNTCTSVSNNSNQSTDDKINQKKKKQMTKLDQGVYFRSFFCFKEGYNSTRKSWGSNLVEQTERASELANDFVLQTQPKKKPSVLPE